MLIDDNPDDNFFHIREIKKVGTLNIVVTLNSGSEALKYLAEKEEPRADLIFLDINMPGMNGWEFLERYKELDTDLQGRAIIVMLTTSDNSDDIARAQKNPHVFNYITKPLTRQKMEDITHACFK